MAVTTDPCDIIVLFGASGDLARVKLWPSLYSLFVRDELRVPILGVALTEWNDDKLRDYAKKAVIGSQESTTAYDHDKFHDFAQNISYMSGDYLHPDTFSEVRKRVEQAEAKFPLFYLAIPPSLFSRVVQSLAAADLTQKCRVVIEKPFGTSLDSALKLNRSLSEVLTEDELFRIDHFLGKEPVQDIMIWRFANTMFEPLFNRQYVSSIQITMAESFGVEDRGNFYDGVGAMRDVVQNHLIQTLALLTMEAPVSNSSTDLRDEIAKVVRAMRPVNPKSVIRGQYDGYLGITGVAPGSTTETYVGLRLEIESWRWAGVPVFIRAGKAMKMTGNEAVVRFKQPPKLIFTEAHQPPPQNQLVFRLGINDGVGIGVQAKQPGDMMVTQSVDLNVDFAAALGREETAYERLVDDAMHGNPMHFAREDAVEASWRVVQPILDSPAPIHPYAKGTWGPQEATQMMQGLGGWHDPGDPA